MSREELFEQSVKVINIGIVEFYETFENSGVEAVHVELPQEATSPEETPPPEED